MSGTGEVNRAQLYNELTKYGNLSEYEKALKVANKILHSFPDDSKVFQYRIVCLIHRSKFEDALIAFNKYPNHQVGLEFEKAYCQYRLNKTEEALETINTAKADSLKLKELKAQVYYRLERYQESFDVYRDIIKNTDDNYEEERQTNLAAVIANICMNGKLMDMPTFASDTYELSYNIACHLIGKGKIIEAEQKLKHAEKLCREFFVDDTSEIDDEIAIMKVQQAYCMQELGREKEAQAIYNSILKQKPSDGGLVAVASSNSVAINKDQNLFDSKKKMKNATSEGVKFKLTSRQKQVIALNNCLLNIYTSQGEQALNLCDQLIKKFPGTACTGNLMKAVVLLGESKKQEAIKLLKEYPYANKDEKLSMVLTIAQLLLSDGEMKEAVKVLEGLGEDKFKPGIISTLVSIHMELGNGEAASGVLQQAVSWHQKNKTTTGDLSALWRHAAELHLRGGKPEVAASSLEELLKINANDSTTLAQLIIAYAQCDPSKAKLLSNKLPHMVDLTPNIDIDTLEASNWMMGSKVIKRAAKTDPSPGTPCVQDSTGQKKKKNVKKRKGKLPKNYDPNVDPDPERWLPRHERSTFRKKKDRRNRDIGKGTQGAATSDQYDMSKMTPTATKSPSVPSSSEMSRHQQRKGQHKKKKGGK
jgi:signal recognition particle subunit SRP72